jgi:hypothetical protein
VTLHRFLGSVSTRPYIYGNLLISGVFSDLPERIRSRGVEFGDGDGWRRCLLCGSSARLFLLGLFLLLLCCRCSVCSGRGSLFLVAGLVVLGLVSLVCFAVRVPVYCARQLPCPSQSLRNILLRSLTPFWTDSTSLSAVTATILQPHQTLTLQLVSKW